MNNDSKRFVKKIPWFRIAIGAVFIWLLLGMFPAFLVLLELISHDYVQMASPYGDMFGAASAYFSGFALIAVLISIQMQNEALGKV